MYSELAINALIYSPLVVIIYAALSCASPMWQRLCGIVCLNSGVTLLAYYFILNGYLAPKTIVYFTALLYICFSLIVSVSCYKGHLTPAKATEETKDEIDLSAFALAIIFLSIGILILINNILIEAGIIYTGHIIPEYKMFYVLVSLNGSAVT